MIGYVRGIVTHLFKESCYVDVHGVGYRVYVPTTTRQQLIEGHEATLFTYLNVREDAMQLYGFPLPSKSHRVASHLHVR